MHYLICKRTTPIKQGAPTNIIFMSLEDKTKSEQQILKDWIDGKPEMLVKE